MGCFASNRVAETRRGLADSDSTQGTSMPQPTPSIKLMLPITDYRVYVSAARLLIPVMGPKAPDALTLIRHTLGGRDATGIADDYLDSVRWPHAAGRMVSLRRPAKPARRNSPAGSGESGAGSEAKLPLGRVGPPVDLSRN